jgi:exodeoxyribonuclease VII small subunit
MSKVKSYEALSTELSKILQEVQSGKIPLEKLETSLNKAKLIASECETRLRKIESELNEHLDNE